MDRKNSPPATDSIFLAYLAHGQPRLRHGRPPSLQERSHRGRGQPASDPMPASSGIRSCRPQKLAAALSTCSRALARRSSRTTISTATRRFLWRPWKPLSNRLRSSGSESNTPGSSRGHTEAAPTTIARARSMGLTRSIVAATSRANAVSLRDSVLDIDRSPTVELRHGHAPAAARGRFRRLAAPP